MSFISGLSFDLVSASTKQPLFSKVDSEGTLWFCAEEGSECFASFFTTAPMPLKVWGVHVDGKSLKKAHNFKKEGSSYNMGIWDSATGVNLPFRFSALDGEGGEDGEQQGGKGGTVSFKVSEYDPASKTKRKGAIKSTSAAAFGSGSVVASSAKDKKGGLKSEVGSRENASITKASSFHTKKGALLAQFECRYMSEIGLVHKKIVVPGEVWDWEKEQEQAAAAEAAKRKPKPKPAKRARETGAEAAPKRAKKEKK